MKSFWFQSIAQITWSLGVTALIALALVLNHKTVDEPPKTQQRISSHIIRINPTAPADRIARAIAASCNKHGIDPYYVTAIMHTESTFRADAESSSGARGLMQIVRSTAAKLELPWELAYDIELNIDAGVKYLAQHQKTYQGRFDLMASRYNGWDDPKFAPRVLARYAELSASQEIVVVVQPGDTLGGIAENYLGDRSAYNLLANYNRIIDANRIDVGQIIQIPRIAVETVKT